MKIFITGISGSGKTYLSKKLSEKYNISTFDLDDIYFKKKYIEKRLPEEAEKILSKKLENLDNWIFEGIYHDWIGELLKKSDRIVWIDLNKNLVSWRIFKRFFKRRKEYKESFWNMLSLIRFQRQYRKIRNGKELSFFDIHSKVLLPYKSKVIKIQNKEDLENLKI